MRQQPKEQCSGYGSNQYPADEPFLFCGHPSLLHELKCADADRGVGIEAEDFKEREGDGWCRGNYCPTDNGQFASIDIATSDRKPAGNDRRDAEHKAEKHDDGQAIADAGLEFGRIEFLSCSVYGTKADTGCQQESGTEPVIGRTIRENLRTRESGIFLSLLHIMRAVFCFRLRKHRASEIVGLSFTATVRRRCAYWAQSAPPLLFRVEA